MKTQIRRDWQKMKRPSRLSFAKGVTTALTGNATFAALNPTAAAIEALRAQAQSDADAVAAAEMALGVLRNTATASIDALSAGLEDGATSAEGISLGDDSQLMTTGFNLFSTAAAAPVGPMGMVQNFTISAGDNDGELSGHCDPTAGAQGYDIQVCMDMTATPVWADRMSVYVTQFTLGGFTSGQRVWVRIRATGSAGPGPWSDPATKIVP